MKKIIFAMTILSSAVLFAQEEEEKTSFISQGTYELTGAVSFSSSNSENDSFESDDLSFGFIPQLGLAVSDDLVIGLGLGFTYNESESSSSFSQITNTSYARSYSFRPYVKKYFSLSENFALNIQGEVEYFISNQESNSFSADIDGFSIGLRPGISYSLNDAFALQAQVGSLGYATANIEPEFGEESTSSSFGFNLNMQQVNIGVSYFF
ncbi:outer membrane beta-barrel protein [Nonlabens ponticola]|nr:outer membrane beta-barrel protein [Nonlabens ponticola]